MWTADPSVILVAMIFTAAQPDKPVVEVKPVVGSVVECQKLHKQFRETLGTTWYGSPITKVYSECAAIGDLRSLQESVEKEIERQRQK